MAWVLLLGLIEARIPYHLIIEEEEWRFKIMPRKGKKRPIQVWGCDLADGGRIDAGMDGIVSVIVHGDHSVSVTDVNNNETIVEGAEWVSYVPRQN